MGCCSSLLLAFSKKHPYLNSLLNLENFTAQALLLAVVRMQVVKMECFNLKSPIFLNKQVLSFIGLSEILGDRECLTDLLFLRSFYCNLNL